MASPFLYHPGVALSEAELVAARLDGHVVEVGDAFMPADAVETPSLRAESLLPLAKQGLIVARWSAAWIYGAVPSPPIRHHLARTTRHRVTEPVHRRVVFHDTPIAAADTVTIASVDVTSPIRTIADLARAAHRDDSASVRAVIAQFAVAGLADPADVIDWIRRHRRMPGARGALRLLGEADAAVSPR